MTMPEAEGKKKPEEKAKQIEGFKLKQRLEAEHGKVQKLLDKIAGLEHKIESQAVHIATLEGGAKPYKVRCLEQGRVLEQLRVENRKLREENEQLVTGVRQIKGKIAERVYEAQSEAEKKAKEEAEPSEATDAVNDDSPPDDTPTPAPSLADEL
jgi:hypothetical protein